MSRRTLVAWELAIVLLLAVVLAVEWWRAGELEDLNARVDELELARQTRRRATTKKPPAATEGSNA